MPGAGGGGAVNRRKFFGVAVGGAAAGPQIAKEAVNRVPSMLAATATSRYYGENCKQDPGSWDYFNSEKARLEKLAAGEEDERSTSVLGKSLGVDREPAAMSINSLRSMSPQHKARMLEALQDRRRREERMQYAKMELLDLLRRFGRA